MSNPPNKNLCGNCAELAAAGTTKTDEACSRTHTAVSTDCLPYCMRNSSHTCNTVHTREMQDKASTRLVHNIATVAVLLLLMTPKTPEGPQEQMLTDNPHSAGSQDLS